MAKVAARKIGATLNLSWRRAARSELEAAVKDLKKQFKKVEKDIEDEAKYDPSLYPPANKYYYWTVGLYISVQLVLASYTMLNWTSLVVSIGIPVNVGTTVLLLQAFHLIKSLRQIGVNDLAGLSLFGRPWYLPKPGIKVVPWGILKLIKADRNYKDERFPGPANKIFRTSKEAQKVREGGDMPPRGTDLVRPIFVMTGEPRLTSGDKKKLEESGDRNPVDRQLVVEIAYFVRYRPDQNYGGIFRIARNLSAQVGSIDQRIKDLVQEQSERDIKAVLARHTPATIVENWDLVNQVFILKLQLTVMRLGIDVDRNGAGLDDLNLSHETNEAQAEVTREQFKKLATIAKAEAEEQKLTREGKGRANAEKSSLDARSDGMKKMKGDLGVGGDAILGAEAVRSVTEKTDVLVVGAEGGMRDILGLVKGAESALGHKIITPSGVRP